MVLASTLLNYGDCHLNDWGKWCWSCHESGKNSIRKELITNTGTEKEMNLDQCSKYLPVLIEGPIPCTVPTLLQIHDKISHQDRNKKLPGHVLMLPIQKPTHYNLPRHQIRLMNVIHNNVFNYHLQNQNRELSYPHQRKTMFSQW